MTIATLFRWSHDRGGEIDTSFNWNEFEKLDKTQKIDTLSMISPVTNEEKQKLLETVSLNDKTTTLLNIIEFYSYENSYDNI